jgi:hypothetical protein
MKVDELIEQERQVKASMSSRAGVLALLLHSTINHEVVSLRTDVTIKNYIFAKKIGEKMALLTRNNTKLCKYWDHSIGF